MLKSIFTTLLTCITIITGVAIIAAIAGTGKVAYDVYNKIDQRQTPVGSLESGVRRFVDSSGVVRMSPYQRFIEDLANHAEREFAAH